VLSSLSKRDYLNRRSWAVSLRLGSVALTTACVLGLAASAQAATFSATTTSIATGDGPSALAIGGLGGSLPGIAVVNGGDQSVSAFLNNGSDNFTQSSVGGTGPLPDGVAIGDFNGDGTADMAVPNALDNTVTVYLSQSGGGYAPTSLATGTFPTSVAAGVLTGNGLEDFAVTNGGDNTLELFLNNGSGGFTTTTLPTGNAPSSVAIGNLGGAGPADLAVTNSGDNTVTVFLSNGSGGYTTTTLPTGNQPASVAIGPLGSNGAPGFAVANAGNNTLTLYVSNGSGGFTASTLTTGNSPQSVGIGDFNGDGLADVAVANNVDNTVTVFLKDTNDSGYTPTTLSTGSGPVALAVGDLSDAGKLDIATANQFSNTLTLLENTTPQSSKATLTATPSTSTFGQFVTFSTTVAPQVSLPGAPTPTGTVTYTVDGVALAPTTVSGGKAMLKTQELGVGTHTITASYSGDANYAPSTTTISYVVTATTTITGTHSGSLSITVPTLIENATITGSVSVGRGGSLDVENSTIDGSFASAGGALRFCGSTIGGSASIANSTGLVVFGDTGDAQCAVNTVDGSMSIANNTNGVEAINNKVHGSFSATGNSGPGPFPGDPTTISGN